MMVTSLTDEIIQKAQEASSLYHRLVLVVAPAGAGKTNALQAVQQRTGAPLVNVNLELSRRLLEMTERQRKLYVPRLLEDIVAHVDNEMVLLDNLELLFDVSLSQNALRLLLGISRHRTVVAAWNGSIEKDTLTIAAPEHPEYRRYPIRDFLVVSSALRSPDRRSGPASAR